MSLLQMKHICKSFSGVYANEDINLTVEKGEIHALLGENGAGKTTLVNIIFGLYTADSGEILWKDKPADFASPREAIDAGIGMVQQHFSLVNKMTVLDNIVLNLKDNSFFLDRAAAKKKLTDLAEKYGLYVNPDAVISDLSVGEQQRVEILKALYRNVELLILDEPTGVLTPQETTQFFDVLRNLKKEGYGIIIITHRMSEIMAISDKVTILRDGRQVADLVTADTNPEELSAYMIGRELNDDYHIEGSPKKDIMLELKNVSNHHRKHSRHKLENISLTIHKGEILGIAGVEGNGQKELAEVITGIQKAGEGEILLDGQNLAGINIRGRYEAGVSYISEDRLSDSLITGMNISENLVLREYGKLPFANHSIINKAAIRKNAAEKMKQYQVRASGKSGIDTLVKLLSGGNQQKLIIARELNDHAKVIVASQPTRGLDIGATEFVRQQLIDQRGLTNIRFTYNSNLRNIRILILSRILREMFYDLIKHISKSLTVSCRNGKWLADSQIIKFINIHHIFLNAVHLIHCKYHWFAAAAKHICNFRIRIHKSLMYICNKDNDIRSINSDLSLLPHLRKNHIAAIRFNTTCVNNSKIIIQP